MDAKARTKKIQGELEAQIARGKTWKERILFRNEWEEFVVIRLPISLFKYRMDNGRTIRQQKEYIDNKEGVPSDLFDDPESDEAQKAQEKILLTMIDKEGLKEDLINEGQKDPTIITKDGFLLNGNRRVAALKDVGEEYVITIVLPSNTTVEDLLELELDLQMAKDTKMEFHWVNELLKIKQAREKSKLSDETIIKKMRLTSTRALKQKIRILDLIDLYLQWIGEPGNYYRIEEKDAWKVLESYHNKFDEGNKKNARQIVFGIFQNPPQTGRVYGEVVDCLKNFEDAIEKYHKEVEKERGEESELEPEEPSEESSKDEIEDIQDDPLKMLDKEKTKKESKVSKKKKPISTDFSTPEKAKKNIEKFREKVTEAKDEAKSKSGQLSAYNAICQAQSKLFSISIELDMLNQDAIVAKLSEIITRAQKLKKEILNLKSE